jgi:hypothetical protein
MLVGALCTDHLGESGVWASAAAGAGANAGVSVCVGAVKRDIEGSRSNFGINAGPVSPSIVLDDQGIVRAQTGFGPGVGAAFSAGNAGTLSVSDAINWLTDW